ncbi:MAG: hypothetical protein V4659_08055 [Pseudomonadota bacterium]
MTDDGEGAHAQDGAWMLYDFCKHITSLCLFSLGGVLALADKVQGRQAGLLVGAVATIGLAALMSFVATGQIVDARMGGKPVAARDLSRSAAPLLLMVGLGMFVYLFTRSLKL